MTSAACPSTLDVIDCEIHVLSGDPSLPVELPHHLVRVPLEAFRR